MTGIWVFNHDEVLVYRPSTFQIFWITFQYSSEPIKKATSLTSASQRKAILCFILSALLIPPPLLWLHSQDSWKPILLCAFISTIPTRIDCWYCHSAHHRTCSGLSPPTPLHQNIQAPDCLTFSEQRNHFQFQLAHLRDAWLRWLSSCWWCALNRRSRSFCHPWWKPWWSKSMHKYCTNSRPTSLTLQPLTEEVFVHNLQWPPIITVLNVLLLSSLVPCKLKSAQVTPLIKAPVSKFL